MIHKIMHWGYSETSDNVSKLLVRLVIGAIFIFHGYELVRLGTGAVGAAFGTVGIPAKTFFAVIVPWVQIVGGTAVVLGLYTRLAAKFLIAVAAVALLTVHVSKGFNVYNGGYEFILLILVSCVSIMIMGAGAYSLDHRMKGTHE